MARIESVLLVALMGAAACHGKQKAQEAERAREAEIEQRAQQLAAKMAVEIDRQRRAEESVRKIAETHAEQVRLLASPQDFFETSGLKIRDTGSPQNPLRTVQELTVTNKSRFPVSGIVARVDFVSDGTTTASVPLTLRGTLPAGGTRRYATADGTLSSAGVQTPAYDQKVAIESVTLEEPPRLTSHVSAASAADLP